MQAMMLFGNEVSGRLSVCRFEPGGTVPVAFRRNGVLENAWFLGAFHSGGAYLLVESGYRWQSVFRCRTCSCGTPVATRVGLAFGAGTIGTAKRMRRRPSRRFMWPNSSTPPP